MVSLHRVCASLAALFLAPVAFAAYHTFVIEQLYSNADGSVQFIVMHESVGAMGESFWMGRTLTSTHAGVTKTYVFPANLPDGGEDYYGNAMPSPTANARVVIATPGFTALGILTPDYEMPREFLATDGGTVNYADVDQVTYATLPTNGTSAINRFGTIVPNVATNFAGRTASVAASGPAAFTPAVGLWWNPNESGSGYTFDVKHGVLVMTMYAYDQDGHAQWYLAAGPLVGNTFTATLDKYRGGQCAACPYTGSPTLVGNDGIVTITFTSATSAVMQLPGNRTTQIQPQVF